MSLKVQGSTAAEHLSKHLLQFGGQMDKSDYLQGLLECFQPCCWLTGYPQAAPSNFAAWHALILDLWGLLSPKGFVSPEKEEAMWGKLPKVILDFKL